MKTAKEITSSIAGIRKRGNGLLVAVHETAVDCLAHASLHGDMTLASKLVAAVPVSHQKNLRLWFAGFGPLVWNGSTKQFTKSKADDAPEYQVDAAKELAPQDWDSGTKAAPAFDADKTVEAVRKYIQTAAKKCADNDVEVPAVLAAVASLLAIDESIEG